jgi:hypothetical protein
MVSPNSVEVESLSFIQTTPAELSTDSKPMGQQAEEVTSYNAQEQEPSTPTIQANATAPKVELEPEITTQPASPQTQLKEWKIPRSKFSVQDLKAAAGDLEIPKEPIPRSKFSVQDLKAAASDPEILPSQPQNHPLRVPFQQTNQSLKRMMKLEMCRSESGGGL